MTTRIDGPPRSDGARPGGPPPAMPPRIGRLPILVLEPHSRCNCRCTMCDIWRAPGATSLDPAAVLREAVSWRERGVERVVLSGGEPLMHPDLWTLVTPLWEAGMGVTLVTTGLLLGRYAREVAGLVDDVVVSLDGPEGVHDDIRGVSGAYRKLARSLAEVRQAAGESTARSTGPGPRLADGGSPPGPRPADGGSPPGPRPADGGSPPEPSESARATRPGPRMSARCTIQRANCGVLPETVTAALELGLEGISFLAVDTTSEAFYRPGGWAAERQDSVAPGRDELALFEAGLERVEKLRPGLPAGFIAESPEKLAALADMFRAYLGDRPFPEARCNAPWVSAVVEPDGTVRPCFFHKPVGRWDQSGGSGALLDVVNSPRAIEFRAALNVATDPVCRRCTCRLNLAPTEDPSPLAAE